MHQNYDQYDISKQRNFCVTSTYTAAEPYRIISLIIEHSLEAYTLTTLYINTGQMLHINV